MIPFFPVYPSYLIVTPIKADSDDEGSSSDEELDRSFSNEMFQQPECYFRLCPGRRGSIVPEEIKITADITARSGNEALKILRLLEEDISRRDCSDNPKMSAVFGFNKMRSLSSRRNRVLQRKLNEKIQSIIPHKIIAFSWKPVFQGFFYGAWRLIDYNLVKKFYRQLKRIDPKIATQFREVLEKSRSSQVPYREIRDFIKNHEATKSLVRALRKEDPNADVYMGFLDADIQSLYHNKKAEGPFEIFDAHYMRHKYEIFTGGYVVKVPENKSLQIGVEADLAVRNATAKYLKNGAYYPEPLTIVKIPKNQETIVQNFSSIKDPNYDSPMEMARLIKQVLNGRQLDPQKAMLFDQSAAIVTTCPDRMNRSFTCKSSKLQGIIRWGIKDFMTMRDINQSHYNARDWAINILRALNLNESWTSEITKFMLINNRWYSDGFEIRNKKIMRDVLISLLSRLFNAFDPVKIAEVYALRSSQSFQKELVSILSVGVLPEIDEIPKNEKVRVNSAPLLWEKVDSCTRVKDLLNLLEKLIEKEQVDLVYKAAKESGNALISLFRKKLCLNYEELFFKSLSNLLKVDQKVIQGTMPKAFFEIMNGNVPPFFDLQNKYQYYGQVTPLHIAALTGNMGVIKKILDDKRLQSQSQQEDSLDQIPFEYGLEYARVFGLDTSLLLALYDNELKNDVQLLITESALDIKDKVFALNALSDKFGKHVVRSFDDDLFIQAIYSECDELVEAFKAFGEYSDVLFKEMNRIAPDVDLLLLEHADIEDINALRKGYKGTNDEYTLDNNLRDAGHLPEINDSSGNESDD